MVQYHLYLTDYQERILEKEAERLGISMKELVTKIAKLKCTRIQAQHDIKLPERPTTCSIFGCTQPILAKGLCGAHYQRMRYRNIHRSSGGET